MARPSGKRAKILEVAREAVLAKGFEATSIEEIVAGAEITKGGFFYHFQDKNALATALIEDYIEEENALIGGIIARAGELADDPLQRALIALKLLAEILEDLPNGHPGCLIATAAYQDRLFDRNVHDMNHAALNSWRDKFMAVFEDISRTYTPREDVAMADLADMVLTAIEGGIILSKGLRDPRITARQVLLVRSYIKLLFSPPRH